MRLPDDPIAVVNWLFEHGAGELTRAQLTKAMNSIAERYTASPEAIPRERMLALLSQAGHVLPSAAAFDLVSALRGGAPDLELSSAVSAALNRAPSNAGLLRGAADLAIAANDAPAAHALLTRLGNADPSLATLQFIRTARAALAPSGDPSVRVALLSSFTIDPVLAYVDLECRALRLDPDIYLAPFNTWERETLGQGSGLERFNPNIVFMSVAADDLMPELAGAAAADDIAAAGSAAVDRLLNAATRFTSWSNAVLVVHTLQTTFRDPLGPAAGRDAPSRGEILAGLNTKLASGLRALPRAYVLDITDVVSRRKQGGFDNPKMRHLASMRLGEHAIAELGKAYARFIAPLMGRTRKCVVLDLDNTLWGGIVGEDGPNGVRLGHTAPGSEFLEFQQYLLSLTRRGVLLAINSKNNAADALEVIRSHDAMILREGAFSAVRINWEGKHNNMLSIAEELSLGLDSFVFVDDSEKERELMRQALPQVLTPEMPRDPSLYRETLESLPELQALTVTEEDRTRTQQYVERRQREDLRIRAQTVDDYLDSLGIVAETSTVSEKTLPRVHQLFQRTNQFNLTGKRYELGALASHAHDDGWRVYTAQVSDRFGDHGLVATALVQVTGDEWTIDNFVMSCRVIGYGVESALLARMGADARAARARALLGEFVATAKNAPARDFYEKNAFVQVAEAGGAQRWRRELTEDSLPAPRWITLRSTNGA